MKKVIIALILSIISILLNILFSKGFILNYNKEIIANILLFIRIPKIITIISSSIILALSGYIYQRLFKNPIITGHTLGITSMGALGASFAILFNLPNMTFLFSILFSLTLLVFLINIYKNSQNSILLLIIGVFFSFFSSSIISILNIFLSNTSSKSLILYLLGSLDIYGYKYPTILLFISIIFTIYTYKNLFFIEVSPLGREYIISKGIDYDKNFIKLLIISSISVSFVAATIGPVGFIGLIIPNFVSFIEKKDYKNKFLLIILYSISFLSISDFISKNIIKNYNLPIGSITSIVGVIFILIILLKFNNKTKSMSIN